jgi:hypothetical protein
MKIVGAVVALQTLATIAAVAALILSLTTLNDRVSSIQQSRYRAAYASCALLEHVVEIAAVGEVGGAAFLHRSGLDDCRAYAAGVIKHG